MTAPNLLVVTVNWNAGAHLADCLNSFVAAAKPGPVHMVVVDNASADGSERIAEAMAAQGQPVTLVRAGENLGFAKGCNLGVAQARIAGFDPDFVLAYLTGSLTVYLLTTAVAFTRRLPMAEAAVEAQCAVVGNVGFLGVPMLVVLLGAAAAGPVLMVLAIDLIVFSSLITLIITASRHGRMGLDVIRALALGLLRNPMIVSMAAGLIWSSSALTLPGPVDEFLAILGAAATPGALFAIGASLATKSAERVSIAAWLSFAKLVLHPGAVAVAALWAFEVDPFAAGVMISAAALPVAGNVYILAQHYGVAPHFRLDPDFDPGQHRDSFRRHCLGHVLTRPKPEEPQDADDIRKQVPWRHSGGLFPRLRGLWL